MYKDYYPNKRYKNTLDFLIENITPPAKVLDLGVENPFSAIMKNNGFEVTNTKGDSAAPLVKELSSDGLKLNVTAIFTPAQIRTIGESLHGGAPSVVSVFAGRIADAGVDLSAL